MRVFVYDYRQFDEAEYFVRYAEEMGIELAYTEEHLRPDNCGLAAGSDFISITTTPVTAGMIDEFKSMGIRMICTRCIGYDHIDIAHAKEAGMIVTHITYEPDGVAEYTVMCMLMAVRKMKEVMANTMSSDFRLKGLLSGEIKDMSIGIIGAGRVGVAVLRDLSGFGCRLYYCNRSRNEEAERYAERLDLDDLLRTCDMVSLHLELNDSTFHTIDSDAISKMKDGVIIVNTARGALVDTDAMISALRNGHLSAAGLDVVEDEFAYYYYDCRDRDLSDHYIGILRAMPNVVLTHHMAFYYRNAVRDMVRNCLEGMKAYIDGRDIPMRLV